MWTVRLRVVRSQPQRSPRLPTSCVRSHETFRIQAADQFMTRGCVIRSGERNRALTIIKSRGTWHSNQVRELILGKTGPVLADVYTAGGEVLMGTLRWEREDAERGKTLQRRAEFDHKRSELQASEADTHAR